MLFRSDSELVEEAMVPDFGHPFPVVDDTMLNGILKVEDTSLLLGLIPNEKVLLLHSHHDGLVLRDTIYRGERGFWGVFT